jgi:hypothetical protein
MTCPPKTGPVIMLVLAKLKARLSSKGSGFGATRRSRKTCFRLHSSLCYLGMSPRTDIVGCDIAESFAVAPVIVRYSPR